MLGRWGWIMSLAAALSAFGSLNGTFFSGGRVCLVAARQGHMVRSFSLPPLRNPGSNPLTWFLTPQPGILAMAHVHRLTPSPALIFTTIISLLVLIPGDFQSIVNYFRWSPQP